MNAHSRLAAVVLAIGAVTLAAYPAAGPGPARPPAPRVVLLAHAGQPATGSLAATSSLPATRSPAATGSPGGRAPVFAYYYIWMRGGYWSRDKLDHPVRPFPGNYNSDNLAVIRWQIAQAKAAGISGFIVSWKDTGVYRAILPLVEKAANEAGGFKLAMLYESLDAARQPLPQAQVAAGFRYFAATYAGNQAWYRIGGKPLTIWFGTQQFSRAAVAAVTGPVRSRILVLSSANNATEFQRLAAYTDGDAYYWSSVYPGVDTFYASKLAAMGAAVHRAHKVWIAPFAPGFNDTLIGGQRNVPRAHGATLRTEFTTAAGSRPDIMGLISWNEWTENTYIEPSVNFGYVYPKLLKNLIHNA